MTTKLKKPKLENPVGKCINYGDMIDFIEKKYKIDTRDYLNSLRDNHKNYLKWLDDNYREYIHVMNSPDPKKPREDWPKDSPEMAKRIEINTVYREVEKTRKEIPYLDFWHIHCDSISGNGSELYLSLDIEEYSEKDQWCKPILDLIKKEFGRYADNNQTIKCWVEW